MKLNRLETHDRFLSFQKQQDEISKGLMDCIANVPDAVQCPFYAYAHSRQVSYDEKVSILKMGYQQAPAERLIWSPRITKPQPTPNSYLFLCRKDTDVIEIIWMLPKAELWDQYAPGQICHNENIWISIQNYKHDPIAMAQPDKNGPDERAIEHFRMVVGHEAHVKKARKSEENLISRLYAVD